VNLTAHPLRRAELGVRWPSAVVRIRRERDGTPQLLRMKLIGSRHALVDWIFRAWRPNLPCFESLKEVNRWTKRDTEFTRIVGVGDPHWPRFRRLASDYRYVKFAILSGEGDQAVTHWHLTTYPSMVFFREGRLGEVDFEVVNSMSGPIFARLTTRNQGDMCSARCMVRIGHPSKGDRDRFKPVQGIHTTWVPLQSAFAREIGAKKEGQVFEISGHNGSIVERQSEPFLNHARAIRIPGARELPRHSKSRVRVHQELSIEEIHLEKGIEVLFRRVRPSDRE
jgi:hypothetical protein